MPTEEVNETANVHTRDILVVDSISLGHALVGDGKVPALVARGVQFGEPKTVTLVLDGEHLRGIVDGIPALYAEELKKSDDAG